MQTLIFRITFFLWLLSGAAAAESKPIKVLLIVAHPDDEYYFAAATYRIAQELHGTVDQVIITNGEGGYRYSTLAEKYYGARLTDEQTGRKELPEIRRKEVLAAGKILGVRNHYFLRQRDQRFTLAANEALDQIWNCTKVRKVLRALMERERYDFVFTLLPRNSTHGHHQAATLLALETVKDIDPSIRPVILGAEPSPAEQTEAFEGLNGFGLANTVSQRPDFAFNRRQSFGFQNALCYEIVVQWVVSEHKSQGMFQNDVGKHNFEQFWRFQIGPKDAEAKSVSLAQSLNSGQQQASR